MNKKLKYLLLGLVLLLAGATPFFSTKRFPETSKVEVAQSQATLIIDFGGGNKISSSFFPQSGTTVFDALKKVAEEKNITLETQQYDFGIFVKAVGGYKSNAKKAWIYFVNGAPGQVAADKRGVKAGDTIEWRYIKPTE